MDTNITKNWIAPSTWTKIRTIDAHTEGEPLRIVIDGFPSLKGNTILEKRRDAMENYDHLRTAIMWEPRGHADMYGCLLTPPVSEGADFGVVFMHNNGYSTMCGHGIIAVAKVVLETGLMEKKEPETIINIDTTAGVLQATAHIENGVVKTVSFRNVPSFVLAFDEYIQVQGWGRIKYDLAFGGAFYAYVQAQDLGLHCAPEHYRELIKAGMDIKKAITNSRSIPHPYEKELSYLYGVIFIDEPTGKAMSRNVCVFADGEVDRSPTGTGLSGRLAILHSRGEVGINQDFIIESIIGTKFSGKILQLTSFGSYPAVVPQVKGNAYITGQHEFYLNPDDPLKKGFLLK